MPPDAVLLKVPLKEEGEGDLAGWKLDIPLTPDLRARIDHLKNNARSYVTALDGIAVHLRQSGGITTKAELESELQEALAGAK
jgi:hypothetical protein